MPYGVAPLAFSGYFSHMMTSIAVRERVRSFGISTLGASRASAVTVAPVRFPAKPVIG
jgi:hypothetical protein